MRILIRTPDRDIAIEGGMLVEPSGDFDIRFDFDRGHVRPGLINAHDHLHRNHYGRLGEPPYPDAYAWARDVQLRYKELIARRHARPRREALLAGAWKNLFAGVTTVVHHDRWEADFERDFPLRVARIATVDSLGTAPDFVVPAAAPRFCTHLAEGVSAAAKQEVDTLDRMGMLSPRLIAVHGVGMDRDAIARFRASGAALVWCPTSNLFLLGRTAPRALLEGVDVLLGSDSLLSGDGDLLDEMRVARSLGFLSDERLTDAVGATAARRLGLAAPSLDPGAAADIIVLTKPPLEARAEDVVLVIVDGIPRVARLDLVPALGTLAIAGRIRRRAGISRWTAAWAADSTPATPPRGEKTLSTMGIFQ
ncbi:amidohydrolase family protein [Sphingomonas sp. JC676]|uniref:amidohydrolase family protein n=1 Tax=Sphingomonas sp. JC676 TaxID=2768065 RepID=UPI0016586877|nr:amidohydrolase family protein [Sphingomonas sp. JC676]MBC9030857.1 amidohydrolase family protein [Sphingomonas sp. JC676]